MFWSNATQPGNPYGPEAHEGKPALEAAIATLSAGPVAPGDRMGLEDKALILRSCRADGLLLKPSRPLTTLDAVHAWRAFGGGGGPQGVVMGTYALLPFSSAAASCSALWCVVRSIQFNSPAWVGLEGGGKNRPPLIRFIHHPHEFNHHQVRHHPRRRPRRPLLAPAAPPHPPSAPHRHNQRGSMPPLL